MNETLTILGQSEEISNKHLAMQEAINEAVRARYGEMYGGSVEGGNQLGGNLIDARITQRNLVIAPELVAGAVPLTEESMRTTGLSRLKVGNILRGDDDRLIVISGPCSIHDPEATLAYAEQLHEMSQQFEDDLLVLMRSYFEKPRTELGWKGFVYDPYLDGSHAINVGLVASRMLAVKITSSGMPIATERLNAFTPQYVNGLITYDAIGARNTLDQKAREYASGTSSPVGFKNTPEGSVVAAAEAVRTANAPHDFIGIDQTGMPMQVTTSGNDLAHIILRGDNTGPNYSEEHITNTVGFLRTKHLLEAIVVDASHGNSRKDHNNQINVIREVARQVGMGQHALTGVMIESNIVEGRQPHDVNNLMPLTYGQSITDACVDLDTTREMFEILASATQERRKRA